MQQCATFGCETATERSSVAALCQINFPYISYMDDTHNSRWSEPKIWGSHIPRQISEINTPFFGLDTHNFKGSYRMVSIVFVILATFHIHACCLFEVLIVLKDIHRHAFMTFFWCLLSLSPFLYYAKANDTNSYYNTRD